MRTISLIDTSILSNNIGDEIIMDSVRDFIFSLYPDAYVWVIPSHGEISPLSSSKIRSSELCFIGGTNLISSNLSKNGLWPIDEDDIKTFEGGKAVTVGVGWNDYSEGISASTQKILGSILSKKFDNSARDFYTKEKLDSVGLTTKFTSCPTTWKLSPTHCKKIPKKKSDSVLFTLTEWRKNPELDSYMVNTLKNIYKNVYFFPQMHADYGYFLSLNISGVRTISANLKGLDNFLQNEDIDFVGTRLHGGIRCLQHFKRTIIISIDNRSKEMGKDISLKTIDRAEIRQNLERECLEEFATKIILPVKNIKDFHDQFIF